MPEGSDNDISEGLKEHFYPRTLYLARILFRIQGTINSFPDKQKLKEFIPTKPVLREILMVLLSGEQKGYQLVIRKHVTVKISLVKVNSKVDLITYKASLKVKRHSNGITVIIKGLKK